MLEVVGFFRVFRVFRGSKCLEIFGKVFIPIRVQGIGFSANQYKYLVKSFLSD